MSVKYPHYIQVQPLRDVSGSNFSKGQINFKFGQGGSQFKWNPSKSYMKIRIKYSKGDTAQTQPTTRDGLGPNMFSADNLWQKECLKINDIEVSNLNDYIAQIGSLNKRMYSNSWLKTVSKTNFSQANLSARINEIVSDGDMIDNNEDKYEFYRRDVVGLQDDAGLTIVTTNTFAIAVDTGVATFATGVVPNVSQIFEAGDVLELSVAGVGLSNYTVSNGINATTIQLKRVKTIAVGQTDLATNFLRLTRKKRSLQSNDREIIYLPCLGFFNQLDAWLPAGNYNYQLTPHPNLTYMRYAVEALSNLTPVDLAGNVAAGFKVEIIDALLYIYKGVGQSSSNLDLTFEESRCQSYNVNVGSLVQRTYVVNKTCHALTVAFQASSSGEDIRFSRSKFRAENNDERRLKRLYLRKGNLELPSPYPNIEFEAGNAQQYVSQLYTENLQYKSEMFNPGGQESLQQWLDRGPYYHYRFDPTGMDDERVYVSHQFNNDITSNRMQILLFDHFYRKVQLDLKDGIIHTVRVSEVN